MKCSENELKIYNSSKLLSTTPAVGHVMNAEFSKTFTPNISFKRFYEISKKQNALFQCGKNELKILKSIQLLSTIPAVGHVMNADFSKTFATNVSFKRF